MISHFGASKNMLKYRCNWSLCTMKIRIYLPYDILLEIGSSLSLLQLNVESEKKPFCGISPSRGFIHVTKINNKLNLLSLERVQKPQSRLFAVMGVHPLPLPSPHHGKRPAKKLTGKKSRQRGVPPPPPSRQAAWSFFCQKRRFFA